MNDKKRYIAVFIYFTLGAFSALAQSGNGRAPDAPAEVAQLDWMIGKWNLVCKDIQRDGSYNVSKAISHVYYVLDGHAVQDDFRALDGNGKVVFRGTSFRTYDPVTKKWSIKWVMVGEPGMTDIQAEFKEGKLVMEGKGYDRMGKFLEKAVYHNISKDHYTFTMSRSYDGGKNWIENFNIIEATRVE